jgi:hypothetical protein
VSDELECKDSDKQGENLMRVENKLVDNWLNLNLSLASWPLYIGGQVSRNRSGLIQITMFVYDTISYFDYNYTWAYFLSNRPQGY